MLKKSAISANCSAVHHSTTKQKQNKNKQKSNKTNQIKQTKDKLLSDFFRAVTVLRYCSVITSFDCSICFMLYLVGILAHKWLNMIVITDMIVITEIQK